MQTDTSLNEPSRGTEFRWEGLRRREDRYMQHSGARFVDCEYQSYVETILTMYTKYHVGVPEISSTLAPASSDSCSSMTGCGERQLCWVASEEQRRPIL